jgi:hypothetical protein
MPMGLQINKGILIIVFVPVFDKKRSSSEEENIDCDRSH